MTKRAQPSQTTKLAFVEPCLAQAASTPPVGESWVHEIKYDGYRVQALIQNGNVALLTRNALDWTDRFGAVVDDFRKLSVESAIIDGEAIVQDKDGVADFHALTRALNSGPPTAIQIMAFDLLHLNGQDLRSKPLSERKAALETLLSARSKSSLLQYSAHMFGYGREILQHACGMRLEGIVSKRLGSTYRSGRNGDWLKAKCVMSDPFIVIGYVASTAASEAIGSLVLGYYDGNDLIYAGRVGSGFSATDASAIWQGLRVIAAKPPALARRLTRDQRDGVHWVEPRLVAEVEYRSWTSDNLIRHANFKTFRTDKTPADVRAPASHPGLRPPSD